MRRLLALLVAGGIAWWLVGRRRHAPQRRATVGFADGSAVTLEPGSPTFDRLFEIAARVAAP